MSRTCTVCNHPSAATIAVSLMEGRSARAVAADYALSYAAMKRHARNHVARGQPSVIPTLQPTGDPTAAAIDPLDELVAALRVRALSGDPSTAREYRLALATQTASKAVAPEYDVLADPEWIKLQGILLTALVPYPESRIAISDAIRAYEASVAQDAAPTVQQTAPLPRVDPA
jgi:hypothetical protein